jgi:hypothetical protein
VIELTETEQWAIRVALAQVLAGPLDGYEGAEERRLQRAMRSALEKMRAENNA